MKMSKVFRKAAELIKTSNPNEMVYDLWCCNAIHKVSKNWLLTEDILFFQKLFKTNDSDSLYWADPLKTNEDQEARRLALLFAAEIAKDQGL